MTDVTKPAGAIDANVLVVGAINVDLVVAAPRLPVPGETVVGPRIARTGGGKGANAAAAAADAGAKTALVGAVGNDESGRFALEDLVSRGVDVSSVEVRVDCATGTALIVVDPAGENQIAVGLGANGVLEADAVSAVVKRRARAGSVVLVSAEIADDTIVAAVGAALSSRATCVLNPAPVVPGAVRAVRSGVVLTPNAGEIVALAQALKLGAPDPQRAATALAMHTGAPVVVTLGARGALVVDVDKGVTREPVLIPAPVVDRATDTTGAGDCFNGTFAAELAAGAAVTVAVRRAVDAAAESVRWHGARRPRV